MTSCLKLTPRRGTAWLVWAPKTQKKKREGTPKPCAADNPQENSPQPKNIKKKILSICASAGSRYDSVSTEWPIHRIAQSTNNPELKLGRLQCYRYTTNAPSTLKTCTGVDSCEFVDKVETKKYKPKFGYVVSRDLSRWGTGGIGTGPFSRHYRRYTDTSCIYYPMPRVVAFSGH